MVYFNKPTAVVGNDVTASTPKFGTMWVSHDD